MSTYRFWISCFAILAFLMLESVPVRELKSQTQKSRQQTQEEREKAMQQMIKQLQNAGQAKTQNGQQSPAGQTQAPAATEQTQTPDAVQTQAPAASGQAPAATSAPTQPVLVKRPALSGDKVQLTYSNADLYDFIVQISEALAISPIVIDPEVKGSVTIESASPMSKDDVFPLFNIILKNNNAALVKQGNIYQIVPISSALKKGLEIIEHLPSSESKTPSPGKESAKPAESNSPVAAQPKQTSQAPKTAKQTPATAAATQSVTAAATQDTKSPRLATHVVRVEFVPIKELLEPLKVFMSDGGVIMPYERLNMLILTDYSDSLNKIMEIVEILDNSFLDPDLIELVRMQSNDAKYVVEDLQKIFGTTNKDSAASGGGVYFTALNNVNAILVMANSKRALAEVKRWITELDASTGRSIQTYIYSVQNSTASNIALILSALYGEGDTSMMDGSSSGITGGIGTRTSASGGTTGGSSGSSRSTFGGSSSTGGGSSSSGLFGSATGTSSSGTSQGTMTGGVFGSGQQLGPRLNQTTGVSAGILRGGEFSGLQGDVRIVVDDINNALIIQASSADYAYIIETIKKMDVLPRQAIIDARIFEVTLTDDMSFGVTASLQALSADPAKRLTTAAVNAAGALSVGTFAIIGDSREILMALTALQTKTQVRVLEAPSVLALDGTEAHIVVGAEVPYQGTSYISTGGSTQSVQYRDTGVSLIVLPRISGSGTVTLTVAQEVSSAEGGGLLGPTFNKASVDTTLAVQDGQTVAIAGLIRDTSNVTRSGIPFLSSLPLIGSLFGQSSHGFSRSELIIMITPHVIKTPDRFDELTQELKDSLRNVRKFVDDKEQERVQDMEDARQERYEQEENKQKEIVPPKSDTK
jgi:general secretion pathway protein D